jgi:protein-disulfide isomerase
MEQMSTLPSKRGAMATKQQKKRARLQDKNKGQFGTKSYGLLLIVIALVVIAVSAFAILGLENRGTTSQSQSSQLTVMEPGEISLDKSAGPAEAPVVVVEYGDFQCPYCKQFVDSTARQVKENYVDPGQARFVFRHLAFLGPESLWAAEATECANEQDRFWDYHDKLFAEQGAENSGTFSQDNLKQFAADLGLDTQQFNQCLDSNKYQTKVEQEVAQAQRLGIRSTPTVFVNGQLIENGSNYQVLQAAIERALSRNGS